MKQTEGQRAVNRKEKRNLTAARLLRDILTYVAVVVILASLGVSTYKITYKLLDYRHSKVVYQDFSNQYATINTDKPKATSKPAAPTNTPANEPESEQQTVPDALITDEQFPIDVDFEKLLATNGDVVGWIYLPDSQINYPVARGEDNDFYLHHLIDRTYSFGGTIFMDVSNSRDWSSKNNILYGHNMNDGSMFRGILKYKEQEYWDSNPYMYLSTPDGNYRLDVFAGFVTESESEIYATFFNNTDSFKTWYEKMQSKSMFKTNVQLTPESRIVTLSTCTYERENMRFVVLMLMRPIVQAG